MAGFPAVRLALVPAQTGFFGWLAARQKRGDPLAFRPRPVARCLGGAVESAIVLHFRGPHGPFFPNLPLADITPCASPRTAPFVSLSLLWRRLFPRLERAERALPGASPWGPLGLF